MFIETEVTPNPATLKFVPGRAVLGEGGREFRTSVEAAASPLVARLFEIDGVSAVYLGGDFVAVTKDGPEWQHLKPAILGTIMEHFMSGAPILAEGEGADAVAGSGLGSLEIGHRAHRVTLSPPSYTDASSPSPSAWARVGTSAAPTVRPTPRSAQSRSTNRASASLSWRIR